MKRSVIRKLLALSFSGLIVAGCSVLESNRAGAPFLNANNQPKRTQPQGSYSLPRQHLNFVIKADSQAYVQASAYSIERDATKDSILPDASPHFRYNINYSPSRFSNDDVDIKYENQLLKSVTVATDDQTGAVLVNLAEALGRVSRLAKNTQIPTPGSKSVTVDKIVAKLSLDPTDPVSLKRAQRILGRGINVRVYPEPRAVAQYYACNYSICYRPLTTVTVSFRDNLTGNITDFVTQVPDPHQIAGLDMERSVFVKRDTVLTFANGTLQSTDMSKPSEVAAAALLPIQIVDAVFKGANDAVKSLLGLRKNELGASTELLNAQANYLKALTDYQKVVDETQSGGANNKPSGTINSQSVGGAAEIPEDGEATIASDCEGDDCDEG